MEGRNYKIPSCSQRDQINQERLRTILSVPPQTECVCVYVCVLGEWWPQITFKFVVLNSPDLILNRQEVSENISY